MLRQAGLRKNTLYNQKPWVKTHFITNPVISGIITSLNHEILTCKMGITGVFGLWC
jgi:hypothetical protein